jgi:membrane protein DedA with SNARE-associated domain
MGLASRVFTPGHRLGHGEDAAYRFALWNLLDSLGWAVSVAASAYGIGRLATGHHTWHDIAILATGLGAGALVTVVAVRRHRRRTARRPGASTNVPPGDRS